MRQLVLALLVVTACGKSPSSAPAPGSGSGAPLRVGVTLHPYYSWTANVVAGVPGAEVVPVLPGEIDAGNYQPSPDDIAKLAQLDAIVINGIGHDDFIRDMIKASGNDADRRHRGQRGDPARDVGPRRQQELAHVHLVHERDPAEPG